MYALFWCTHSESVWSPADRKGLCVPCFDAHTVRGYGPPQVEQARSRILTSTLLWGVLEEYFNITLRSIWGVWGYGMLPVYIVRTESTHNVCCVHWKHAQCMLCALKAHTMYVVRTETYTMYVVRTESTHNACYAHWKHTQCMLCALKAHTMYVVRTKSTHNVCCAHWKHTMYA